MDQIKIGRFIAECRKNASLTQLQLAEKLGPGKTVVTVLPDTAERYFSTPLFDE